MTKRYVEFGRFNSQTYLVESPLSSDLIFIPFGRTFQFVSLSVKTPFARTFQSERTVVVILLVALSAG